MAKTILVGSALPILDKHKEVKVEKKIEVKETVKKEQVAFKTITLEDLIKLANTSEKVFIVGFNGDSITKLFMHLQESVTHHKFLNTNDFVESGDFNDQMSECMKTVKKYRKGCVMGGVQMFRVLRRIESLGEDSLRPNVVVRCFGEVLPSQETMVKGLETMWDKYLSIVKDPLPLFFDYRGE